jgi:electron transfer flavoprotein beta subunit
LFFCPFFFKLLTLFFQKAKKKPLAQMTPGDLGVDINPSLTVLSVEDPPVREAGSKVKDVDQLIAKLKDSGVI